MVIGRCYPASLPGRAAVATDGMRAVRPLVVVPSSGHDARRRGRPRPARWPRRHDGRPPVVRGSRRGSGRADRRGRGDDADARPASDRAPASSSCAGRTVTPGFGDAHVHPVSAGVGRLRCDLTDARGLDAYLATIAAYAAAHPDEAWIRGDGWSMSDFPGGIPHRGDLDRVVPDRPVYLESRDGHTAWVNSRALELAGVTADTPDPDDGRIERDADGGPGGALQEGAADLVGRLLPADTAEELVAGLRLAQAELHSLGITTWQDAIVDARPGGDRVHDARRSRRADGPRRRRALVGPGARRGADRGARRAARAHGHRPLRADERQADAGRRPRERDRRPPRAISRRRRPPDERTAA